MWRRGCLSRSTLRGGGGGGVSLGVVRWPRRYHAPSPAAAPPPGGEGGGYTAAATAAFFAWCADVAGIETRRLAVRREAVAVVQPRCREWNHVVYATSGDTDVGRVTGSAEAPRRPERAAVVPAPLQLLRLEAGEPLPAGAVLASVPYTACVINVETIRGKQGYPPPPREATAAPGDVDEAIAPPLPRVPLALPSAAVGLAALQSPRRRCHVQRAASRLLARAAASDDARRRGSPPPCCGIRATLQAACRARPLDRVEAHVFWLSGFLACQLKQRESSPRAASGPQGGGHATVAPGRGPDSAPPALAAYFDAYVNRCLFPGDPPSPFALLALPPTPPGAAEVERAVATAALPLLYYPALLDGITLDAASLVARYDDELRAQAERSAAAATRHHGAVAAGSATATTTTTATAAAAAARGKAIRVGLQRAHRQRRAAELALHDALRRVHRDAHEQLCFVWALIQLYNVRRNASQQRRARRWARLHAAAASPRSRSWPTASALPPWHAALLPTVDDLWGAYLHVLQRAVLLPLHCHVSAPLDLAEFLAQHGDDGGRGGDGAIPLLPSLVPIVDLFSIDGPSLTEASGGAAVEEHYTAILDRILHRAGVASPELQGPAVIAPTMPPNALLYTCVASSFAVTGSTAVRQREGHRPAAPPTTGATTRRRVLGVDTQLLSTRRVVVCGAVPIASGQSVVLPCGGGSDGGVGEGSAAPYAE